MKRPPKMTPDEVRAAYASSDKLLAKIKGVPMTRPAHRPRFDPKAARKLQTYRLHPDTIKAIERIATREQVSRGMLIDRMFKNAP